MIRDLPEWVSSVRDTSLAPDAPVKQKDGRWEIASRKDAWIALGPRVFDEHLDRLEKVAVEVLRERDPQLELEPDDRLSGKLRGKTLKHSRSIRAGLAETLALLGSLPTALTSCSHGKAETTAILAVRKIFEDADWVLWASLNDHLPMLAEAAPDEFLDIVEGALERSPCPFADVFRQEAGGVFGRNYMTGLLWGLETLAWSDEYLQRVTVLLGDLAAIDPGGNWCNRPANSLADIFLPWHPQTCASVQKRKTAVTALLREQAPIGWKLLLSLLPSTHSATSGTHKPTWRSFIPNDWSDTVTHQQYWDQVKGYADLAVAQAATDLAKLSALIERLPNLPDPAYSRVLEHLGSDAVVGLSESSRLPLWEALTDLTCKQRKHPDAKWAMPSDARPRIDETAAKLAPTSIPLIHRRLFSAQDYELFDERGNYDEQQKELNLRRQSAVREILASGQVNAVLEFAHTVERPETLGHALGSIESEPADAILLPSYLDDEEQLSRTFVSNFVWGRFWTKSWPWVDSIIADSWTAQQKAALFGFLPFVPEAWRRAESCLGNDAGRYWKLANVNPYAPKDHLLEAVGKLIDNGRPRAAVSCLHRLIHEKFVFSPQLAIQALMEGINSSESPRALDQHDMLDVIEWLQQNSETDEAALFRVEWAYLPLLDRDYGKAPKTLEARLARDPTFFCEVIATVFKSDKDPQSGHQPTDQERNVAQNAYRLLHGWQTVPGRSPSGAFDGEAFQRWLAEVTRRTRESGHLRVAMSQVGQVLPYAPPDPNGLWIHDSVANALNARDADGLRSGFTCELFNQRGVHGFTAGKEELEIANGFRMKAEALEERGYQRIATAIRELAKGYERDAERESKRDPFKD